MAMPDVVVAQGLTKYYGRQAVVDALNLRIPAGSIYGLLGRNGAGKSTAIKMLLGLVHPSRGRAELLGEDSVAIRPETRGTHRVPGGRSSAAPLDDRRPDGPVHQVPSIGSGTTRWSARSSITSSCRCARGSAICRAASALNWPWLWRWHPIRSC